MGVSRLRLVYYRYYLPMKKWLLCLCYAAGACVGCVQRPLARQPRAGEALSRQLEDSVAATLARLRTRAVAMLTVRPYAVYGGTGPMVVLWQEAAGTSHGQTFGPDGSARVFASPALDTLFSFCRQQPLGPWPVDEPLPAGCPYDGGATAIGVYWPGRTQFYRVHDCERHRLRYAERVLLPGEEHRAPTQDPRNVWLDLFEKAMQ